MNTILLEIITPEKILFKDDVRSVICPAEEGKLGVLPGHADLLARLKAGEVQVTDKEGKIQKVMITGGFLEVHPRHLTILAE